jgi:hypothetical protein
LKPDSRDLIALGLSMIAANGFLQQQSFFVWSTRPTRAIGTPVGQVEAINEGVAQWIGSLNDTWVEVINEARRG